MGWCTVCVGCHLYGIAEEPCGATACLYFFSRPTGARRTTYELVFSLTTLPTASCYHSTLQDGCELLLERLNELYVLYRRALAERVGPDLRQDAAASWMLISCH